MFNKRVFMTMLAAGMIGFGAPAHAFGLGLLAGGLASLFGWGESTETADGEAASPKGMGGLMRGFSGKGGKDAATPNVEERLASLKTELALSPEQEALWNAYADASKGADSAYKQLTEALSPDQRKIAEQHVRRGGRGMAGKRGPGNGEAAKPIASSAGGPDPLVPQTPPAEVAVPN